MRMMHRGSVRKRRRTASIPERERTARERARLQGPNQGSEKGRGRENDVSDDVARGRYYG